MSTITALPSTTITAATANPPPNIIIDLHANYELSVLFTALSTLSFFVIGAILVTLAIYNNALRQNMRPHFDVAVFSVAVVLTVFEMLSFEGKTEKVNHISRILIEVVFGIIMTVWGAYFFFTAHIQQDRLRCLSHGQHNITKFIWAITIVLLPFEIVLVTGAILRTDTIATLATISAMIQKFVQAYIYKFSLQIKVPKMHYQVGALWYFRLLALFNFLLWLNDLINSGSNDAENLKAILKNYYSVFSEVYRALVIDYRLLLTILFIEHSISVNNYPNENYEEIGGVENGGDRNDGNGEHRNEDRDRNPPDAFFPNLARIRLAECSGLGNIVGFLLCGLQLLNALQYKSEIGAWTNIFGILVDLLTVVCGVCLMIEKNKCQEGQQHENNAEDNEYGVQLLMIVMGVISMVFWTFKCGLVFTWASKLNHSKSPDIFNYLVWNGVKFATRVLSTLSQIHVFVNFHTGIVHQREIQDSKKVHALVPLYMLLLLAIFISSVIGTYTGTIDIWMRGINLRDGFKVLYDVGGPFHLGFCLHVFVHFILLSQNLIAVRI